MIHQRSITTLLWRHEVGGAHHGPRHGHAMVGRFGLGETKIREFWCAGSVEKDIGGLDVAMDDPLVVSCRQAFAHLTDHVDGTLQLHGA